MENLKKENKGEEKIDWIDPILMELKLRETSKNFIQCDGIGVPGEDYACFS